MKTLAELAKDAWEQGRRLVAPFLGFPGLRLLGISVKLAEQNSRSHFNTIKKLVEIFSPDIIFPLMDLTVEANALGRYTLFPVNDYPTVPKERFDFEEIKKLKEIDISADGRVNSYLETVRLMSRGLPKEVIKGAYVTGPYTLSSLIMGAEDAAAAALSSPKNLHRLCALAARKIIEYSNELIVAGAQVICILEPSAVILGPKHFQDFSASYVMQLVAHCRNQKVNTIYHVCGKSMHLIEKMVNSGSNGISLDSKEAHVDLVQAANKIPEEVAIIGNIDAVKTMLLGTPGLVKKEVLTLITEMKPFPNFILSTGCDLPQKTPLENIHAFMKAGRGLN